MNYGHWVKGQGQLWHCILDLVDKIQTTVFAQSLSNFTCKLWMMRVGALLIWGHGVKGQGQLYPPARGCHALRCLVSIIFDIWGLRPDMLRFPRQLWHCVLDLVDTIQTTVFAQSLSNFTCKL